MTWPNQDNKYDIYIIDHEEDYLMHIDSRKCPRLNDIDSAVAHEIATELMYDEIDYDMEHSGFYQRLRHLSDLDGERIRVMHQLCDYIYWARESNIEIFFNLDEEDIKRCKITKERGVYQEFYAYEESNALRVYELIKTFGEFAEIVQDNIQWYDAPYWTKYFKINDHSAFPKYILYSTHQETIAPLLSAFKHLHIINPRPASSFYLIFFRRPNGEIHVKVDYSDYP